MAVFRIAAIKRNEELIKKVANSANLPGNIAIRLRRVARTLLSEGTDFDAIREAKIRELGEVDGDKVIIKEGTPESKEFMEYMNKLLSTEIEVEFEPIDINLFDDNEKTRLTPADFDDLVAIGILKDDTEVKPKNSLRETLKKLADEESSEAEVVESEPKKKKSEPGKKKYASEV